MAIAAEESDVAQQVLPPIPADTNIPRHPVMPFAILPAKVKFQIIRRFAAGATAAELENEFGTRLPGACRFR